jgi:single-strand DNA-binding protein
MNFCKLIIVGRFVRDPELKQTANRLTVGNFCIAYSVGFGDNKRTSFLDCTAWKLTAENINKFFHKGDPILIEGVLEQQKYTGRDGEEKTKWIMTVNQFDFVGGNKQSEGSEVPKIKSTSIESMADTEEIPF